MLYETYPSQDLILEREILRQEHGTACLNGRLICEVRQVTSSIAVLREDCGGARSYSGVYLRGFVTSVQLASKALAGALKLDLLSVRLKCKGKQKYRNINIPSMSTKQARQGRSPCTDCH